MAPEFGSEMKGEGRWFVMEDDDGSLFGILWTDDKDALGLLGTEFTSGPHQQAGDTLLAAYEPADGYGAGRLEDLFNSLQSSSLIHRELSEGSWATVVNLPTVVRRGG